MAEPVYVQAGANVEATDTFASWINTTNALVYDMGTKVLTTTTFIQPNTSVGGYVTGNSQIEGIFSANTLTATTALRGGTVSTSGNLNVTSNTIFSDSNLIQVGANTDNFNIYANNMYITSGITANTTKSVTISAANTNINAGGLFVKTDASFTGTRVDIDGSVFDVTSNTVYTAATLNANVDIITLGFNGSDALNVNAVSDFNANVNIDGILTSTANALFTGAQAQFDNNVIIGSSVADSLTVNAYLVSDLLPTTTTVDLGSASKQYGNVHTMFVYAGSDVEAIGEVVLKGTAAKTLRVTGSNGSYQNLNITFSNNSVSNTAIVANTSGLFGGVNQLYSLGSSSVNWKDLYVQNSFVTGNEVVTGDVAVNGGDITTSATTFNLLETGATTLNAFGVATAIDIGANSGTITINNPTLVGSQTTQNVYNSVATTVNAFGAATAISLGAPTGTATFNNASLAFNGGTVSTSNTTFTLLNTTATTVNAFGAATAINLGANTGTLTIASNTIVGAATTQNLFNTVATTVNAFGTATTISLGAASGNTTINNNAVVTGDVAVNGGDITTTATTFNLVNGTATTLNVGGAATTLNIGNATGVQTITVGGSTTANSTYNIATGATGNTFIKTVNVGTGANTGSTTNVNIGSSNGGTTTVNSGTIVGAATTQNVFNTVATTVNAFGAATALNIGQANGVLTLGKDTGNTSVIIAGNGFGGTATLDTNVTTGKFRIASNITTGTVELGSSDNTGSTKILFTTNSDTIFTGALTVAGGVGVAKTIRVGNNAIVEGDLTVKGAVDFQGNVNVNLAEANTATLKVTSSAQFIGTIGSSMIPGATSSYNIGSTGSRWLNLWTDNITATNTISANNISAATSLIAGAFTVKSGAKDAIILDANVNGSSNRTITLRTPASALSANAIVTFADGNTAFQVGTMAITGGTLAQFAATTSSQLAGVISDETGSGSLVFATSPTLVTPTIGVATATSINKVTITTPSNGSTLTIADGKTATINNTLTFSGTDASTVTFGAGGTVVYTSNKLSALSSTTSSELAGVISDETGIGSLVFATAPTFSSNVDSSATFGAFASATALTLGYTGTAASTLNVSTGAVAANVTKIINIGTGGANTSITNINFGSATAGANGTATFNNDVNIKGNLIVDGTTLTVNSTTITVDDKNIELGSIANPTNTTADGGGITLKGTTDKTFNWVNATGAWTSSEDINLASGKTYKIDGVNVIGTSGLANTVTTSNLTSVGVLTSGTWNATTIAAAYGGTGQSSYTIGDLLVASGSTTLSKLSGVATGNALISGGANTSPTWGKIGLTTHVSGTLPIANGGTGQTTANNAFDALSPMTTLGDIIYEAAGPTATRLAGNTTTTKNFLSQTGNGTVSAAPSWSTVTKTDVGLGSVENTALSTWPGTANVVTVGTITTGTWNAGLISSTYGGTGVNNGGRTLTINTGNLTIASQAAGSTISLGGNITTANSVTTSGNFALTLTTTAATNVTLPTTGTLVNTSGTGATGTWAISVSGNANTVTNGVYTTGDQTIAGIKTFSSTISGSINGNAATVTNGVYTTGNQTIAGVKTFSNALTVDNGANIFTDLFQGRTGTLGSGNPMLYLKKTANTAFEIGGYNGAATEGVLTLNFSSITAPGKIVTSAVTTGGYTDQDTVDAAFYGAVTQSASSYAPIIKLRSTGAANVTSASFGILHNVDNTQEVTIHSIQAADANNRIWRFASTGDFTSPGNVTAYSDERLKSNIRTIDNALDKVTSMRGVYFDKDGQAGLGVIAQEVEKVLPEVVLTGEYKSVAYGNIVGVLIEAIKELKAEIEDLKRGK